MTQLANAGKKDEGADPIQNLMHCKIGWGNAPPVPNCPFTT